MKTLLYLALSLAVLNSCGTSTKTVKKVGFRLEEGMRTAVLRFEGKDPSVGDSLSDAFITELMDIGFDVIERSQLEKLLQEQKIGMSGVLDTKTIRNIGKIAGVDILVLGRYSFHKKTKKTIVERRLPVRRRGRKKVRQPRPGQRKVEITSEVIFSDLSIRFVDVETGQVVTSCTMKKEFYADEVGDCLSEMAESIKKNLHYS